MKKTSSKPLKKSSAKTFKKSIKQPTKPALKPKVKAAKKKTSITKKIAKKPTRSKTLPKKVIIKVGKPFKILVSKSKKKTVAIKKIISNKSKKISDRIISEKKLHKSIANKAQTPQKISVQKNKQNQVSLNDHKKNFKDTLLKKSKDTHKKVIADLSKRSVTKSSNFELKTIIQKAQAHKEASGNQKNKLKKQSTVAFTLEDVRSILEKRSKETTHKPAVVNNSLKDTKKKKADIYGLELNVAQPLRTLGAASLSDILGYDLNAKNTQAKFGNEAKVPEKFKKFYQALLELRAHVKEGMEFHTQNTLKRSSKEESGNSSGYSQHMADAATDNFDRDFALNLLSNEQEALYEIEEAIHRIFDGSYGICEVNGKPIAKERLMAVPFTRCSLEGQQSLEGTRRKSNLRTGNTGIFSELTVEDSSQYIDDDTEM